MHSVLGGGGVADRGRHREVVDGGHLHNDYLFSKMRQKIAHQRSNAEHRKLISMRFRLRQRARRLGRRSQWESGHGKQHVRVNSIKLFAFPHRLHTLGLCVCVCALLDVNEEHACVHPYILNHVTRHEQSCTVWKAPLYIAGQCWVSQQSIVGVRSSLSHQRAHDLMFLSSVGVKSRQVLLFIFRPAWKVKSGHEKHFKFVLFMPWLSAYITVNFKDQNKD